MLTPKKKLYKKLENKIGLLYPNQKTATFKKLIKTIKKYEKTKTITKNKKKRSGKIVLNEKDSMLITYGDTFKEKSVPSLKTLNKFLKTYGNNFSCVHILPFFPYSSDDGFSVKDYKKVRVDLGNWKDIETISKNHRIMADLVLNHCSVKSFWFKEFIKGNEKYSDYFISFDKKPDLSNVFRPRTNPVLTKFKTKNGERFVWTTFSEDQPDLNYKNPEVLLEMTDIMLFYISKGVEMIRLDAIAYIWKELGTNCLNMKEAHEIVKFFRIILDIVAPYALIITETNLPSKFNVSYVGTGHQGNVAYQFSLPSLVMQAFLSEDSKRMKELIKENDLLDTKIVFLNFLASHDGIGVLDARERLSKSEFEKILDENNKREGKISYKNIGNKKVPYELNINYLDAVSPKHKNEDYNTRAKKFLASQAILLGLKGFPGIYIHSFIGSQNNQKEFSKSGIKRKINREKIGYKKLEKLLKEKGLRNSVFKGYKKILEVRQKEKAFSPFAKEKYVDIRKKLFCIERKNDKEIVVVLVNLSDKKIKIKNFIGKKDLISGNVFEGIIEGSDYFFLK